MRDDLNRALQRNPDYPPGFDPRELEDAISTGDDEFEDDCRFRRRSHALKNLIVEMSNRSVPSQIPDEPE